MGTGAAFKTTGVSELGLLSAEEKAHEASLKAKQAESVQYVRHSIFTSMPVTVVAMETPVFGRKRAFITIDRVAVGAMREGLGTDGAPNSPNKRRISHAADPLLGYPDSVVVDEQGDIHIDNGEGLAPRVIAHDLLSGERSPPPQMTPPELKQSTCTTLAIKWSDSGSRCLIDHFEVQYQPCHGVGGGSSSPAGWRLLCSKGWRDPELFSHQLDNLKPCTAFKFRCRQRNTVGWSDWSESSPIFATLADVPAQPQPPFASYISSELIQLHWLPPRSNGSPVERYVLRGKLATSKDFQVLYEGALISFVVVSMGHTQGSTAGAAEEDHAPTMVPLQASEVYVFDVRAHNAVGSSPRSELLTCNTPGGRATVKMDVPKQVLRSRSSWLECWDSKNERLFYFNRITGVRVDDPPEPFVERQQQQAAEDAPAAVDPIVAFRKKRFRLLRQLYQSTGHAGLGRIGRRQSVAQDEANLLRLRVQRESVFEDTAEQFRLLSGQDLCRKSKVRFAGEEGIDSGGLTKDWYACLSRAFCDPKRKLFTPVPADSGELEIDPNAKSDEAVLETYKFVGKVIGKAIYDRQNLTLPMTRCFYKLLRNIEFGMEELEFVDPAMFRSLKWMLDNPIEGILFETFSVTRNAEQDPTSAQEEVDLCPDGRDREVTDENKTEYVELMSRWRLRFGVHQQLESLLHGIGMLVPLELLAEFDTPELELLINGKKEIDVDEVRSCAIYQGSFTAEHRNVLWLWHTLKGFDQNLRAAFLRFVTGSTRIPLDGFDPPFNVTEGQDMDLEALPRAHTCFNQLVLPRYRTLEVMTDKVKFAIANAEGFQLA